MKRPKPSGAGAKSAHLLGTSTLLWALGEPERLSPRGRRLVDAGENIVSVASYWEIVIKTQKGLLTSADLATWWRQATELTAARVLPIRASHIMALAKQGAVKLVRGVILTRNSGTVWSGATRVRATI